MGRRGTPMAELVFGEDQRGRWNVGRVAFRRPRRRATVGAVFDVEQWFVDSLADGNAATVPLYVTYLLLAYDDIYDIYGETSEIVQPPYDSTVEGLFDMRHYFDDVAAALPASSQELLESDFLAELMGDAQHPVRVRLLENAVDRWTPGAPVSCVSQP